MYATSAILPSLGSRSRYVSSYVYDENTAPYYPIAVSKVILDTGSPDLWVVTDSALPGSVNTSVPTQLNYGTDAADGSSVQGDIFTAEVEFAGFTIAQQAYSECPSRESVAHDQYRRVFSRRNELDSLE